MQKFAAVALLVACLAVAAQAANSTHSANGTHHAPSHHHKSHTYHFKVTLVGNGTKASGKIAASVDLKKKVLTGTFFLKNIADMTMAHFHYGAKGVDGPVVAWIYPFNKVPLGTNGTKPISIGPKGATLKFTIKAKDIVPTANVKDFNGLVAAIKKHDIYANVHTVAKPGGEIRGQTV